MEYLHFAIILSFATLLVNGSSILFILPFPVPSHFNCFYPLMVRLTERGHDVTVIASINPKNDNITLVELDDMLKYLPVSWAKLRAQSRLENMFSMYDVAKTYVSAAIQHKNYRKFVHDNSIHFDLIMVELYYIDAYLTLGRRYNAPVIGLVPQTLVPVYGWLTNNPIDFSYIPNFYLSYNNEMSFMQRVTNTFFGLVHVIGFDMFSLASNQEIVNRHVDYLEDGPTNLKSMLKDISLILVNSHYSMGYPRPFLPNVVEVAGIHLKPTKPLPQNIQNFMDEAINGTVYISFGTMVDPAVIEKWGTVILDVFRNSPIRVIWKWNETLLENIPDNFIVQNWMPQNDILQHPNCKLFITHGGVHSFIESVNAGVPIIGVPFFNDQLGNIATAEKLGIGIRLADVEKNNLQSALNQILKNPQYQKNMNRRSKLFKDRLADPLSMATHWIEHVIRHKGAQHLKSGAAKLSWYQYLMLDVILFSIACSFAFVYLAILIPKYLFNFLKSSLYTSARLVTNYLHSQKKVQ